MNTTTPFAAGALATTDTATVAVTIANASGAVKVVLTPANVTP